MLKGCMMPRCTAFGQGRSASHIDGSAPDNPAIAPSTPPTNPIPASTRVQFPSMAGRVRRKAK